MSNVGACTPDEFAALTTALAGNDTIATNLCTLWGDTNEGLNTFFLTIMGALVFLMHGGFAMLCAGAIRSKNTMNILLQTILDAAVSALAFYLVGYAFAYGDDGSQNPFIGNGKAYFALSNMPATVGPSGATGRWSDWLFQWAFAATATTIPAGCVAERFNFNAYLCYTILISSFIYPTIVHWVWSGNGWLSAFNTHNPLIGSGMIDFAGSGVVHMTGGVSGLVACILVGPRLGRFDSNGKPVDMPGHSATLVVLGTVLLWFGWYGFNPGSTLNVSTYNSYQTSGRASVTTTLSGSAAVAVGLLFGTIKYRSWDLLAVCNAALVGFVAITAGCATLEPWAACIVGGVGTLIFEGVCSLWLRLRIDDPLAASPMHGACGAWGVLFVGFLAHNDYVNEAYPNGHYGAFYPGGGGRLLACQIIGILVIFGWCTFLMGILCFGLKLVGKLRISPEEEQAGLDVSKHGGSAYNYDHGLGKPEAAKI